MKLTELNHQKLAQVLLATPLSALEHKHPGMKETLIQLNSSPDRTIEIEFVHDLFSLNKDEVVDKWYDGKENIAGFFYEDR